MYFFQKFNRFFGFTQNEGRIILFLITTFIIGGMIKLLNILPNDNNQFDYSSVDQEFLTRSALITNVSQQSFIDDSLTQSSPRQQKRSTKKAQLAPKSININKASKSELVLLPGIGEIIAERIILYRKEHGNFRSIQDIMKVKGIGKKKFEMISPYITVLDTAKAKD